MELEIRWQRLVKDGETCERCSGTEEELEEAVSKLEKVLNGQEVDVKLEKEEIDEEEFREQPEISNRIFINEKPLEDLIDAEHGTSQCCDLCGENQCRTVEKDGHTFEKIPSELIVSACLEAVVNSQCRCGCSGSCQ